MGNLIDLKSFFNLLKKQAIFFLNRPALLCGLLVVNFLAAYFTYSGSFDSTGRAVLGSGMFTVLWGAIYFILPAFILIGFVFLGIVVLGAIIVGLSKVGGSDAAVAGGAGMFAAGLLIVLAFFAIGLVIVFGPGVLVGGWLHETTHSDFIGIASFILISIVMFIILKLFFEYVLPFVLNLYWVTTTAMISHEIVRSTFGFEKAARHISSFRMPDNINGLLSIADNLFSVIQLYMLPPGAIGWWALLFGMGISAFAVYNLAYKEETLCLFNKKESELLYIQTKNTEKKLAIASLANEIVADNNINREKECGSCRSCLERNLSFCTECGYSLREQPLCKSKRKCSFCGKDACSPIQKFCVECGNKLLEG
jgi:hypothetical protein